MKTNEKKRKKEKKREHYFSLFKRVRFQTFECLHEHKYYVLWFQLLCTHEIKKPSYSRTRNDLPIFVFHVHKWKIDVEFSWFRNLSFLVYVGVYT